MTKTPFAYAYRYPDGIRFETNAREINGSRPSEAIPLYTAAPAAADGDAEPPTKAECYSKSIAAAQTASEAAAELLRCAREEDAIPIEDVLEKLLNAAQLVGEIEERPEDEAILEAIYSWQTRDRE